MPRSHRDAQQALYHASLIIKYRFAVACHTMSMSRLSHKRMAFDGGSLAITSGLPGYARKVAARPREVCHKAAVDGLVRGVVCRLQNMYWPPFKWMACPLTKLPVVQR